MSTKETTGVWLGLWLAIALDTGVQLCWKMAVLNVPPNAGLLDTALDTLKQPLFFAVLIMFFSQLINWLKVLGKADLSFAQPITSLSYVSVGVLSALLLHERLSAIEFFGIAMILVGVWFISQTEHHTTSAVGDKS